jgi:hypothetical protein
MGGGNPRPRVRDTLTRTDASPVTTPLHHGPGNEDGLATPEKPHRCGLTRPSIPPNRHLNWSALQRRGVWIEDGSKSLEASKLLVRATWRTRAERKKVLSLLSVVGATNIASLRVVPSAKRDLGRPRMLPRWSAAASFAMSRAPSRWKRVKLTAAG